MMVSPFSVYIIGDGQAVEKNEQIEKNEVEEKSVSLYITSTGFVEYIDFDEYIISCVMAEIPSSFDDEAIKAMSVAVRSYVLRRMNKTEKYTEHFSADVCDDFTHCLGYMSKEDGERIYGKELYSDYYGRVQRAVEQTKGEVLCYNGEIIDAVFHASSNKYTESAENIWGYEIPYLKSVKTDETPQQSRMEYSPEEFRALLENEGIICSFPDEPIEWIMAVDKNEQGRVESVSLGDRVVTGRRTREIFGLASTSFNLFYENDMFVFDVKGNGHGVGMSQYGCQEMAEKGKGYKDILAHYYKDTEIELKYYC